MTQTTIANSTLLTLSSSTDPGVAGLAEEIKGLTVIRDAPDDALVAAGSSRHVVPRAITVGEVEQSITVPASDDELLVVDGVLDDDLATRLEDAGRSYIDRTGRHWVVGQDLAPRARRSRSRAWLKAPSIRALQLIADHPGEEWTLRRLAADADTTEVTTHRLLTILESAGLLERTGGGRSTRRRVRDRAALLRWLVERVRPTDATILNAYVPDPLASARSLTELQLILTGTAAAERMGIPVVSASTRPLFRIDVAENEIEEVPGRLGGFRTDRGANVTFVADPGRLAALDSRQLDDGLWIAPPSRVMLDMYLEPRGAAAADAFLSLLRADE